MSLVENKTKKFFLFTFFFFKIEKNLHVQNHLNQNQRQISGYWDSHNTAVSDY